MQFIVNVSTRIEREMSGRCARNVRLAAATMHTNESIYRNARNRFVRLPALDNWGVSGILFDRGYAVIQTEWIIFDLIFFLSPTLFFLLFSPINKKSAADMLQADYMAGYGSSLRPATPNIFGSVSKWQEPCRFVHRISLNIARSGFWFSFASQASSSLSYHKIPFPFYRNFSGTF